jgi:hypothetical protein
MISRHNEHGGCPLQLFHERASGLILAVTGALGEIAGHYDDSRLQIRHELFDSLYLPEVGQPTEVDIREMNDSETHVSSSAT